MTHLATIMELADAFDNGLILPAGICSAGFYTLWSVARTTLTLGGRMSFLRSDGRWSQGHWDDRLILADEEAARRLASRLDAVPAYYPDVIRNRIEDAVPADPSSVVWWNWIYGDYGDVDIDTERLAS